MIYSLIVLKVSFTLTCEYGKEALIGLRYLMIICEDIKD